MNKFLIILFFCFSFTSRSIAQDSLALKDPYVHSTKKATIWSAVIPGFGQFYNEIGYRKVSNKKHRAWWKAPIIWGGLGTLGYFYYINNKESNLLKEEILFRRDYGYGLHSKFDIYTTENQLINEFDFFSSRRDIFIFSILGLWALQTIEALVDAHFVSFDVSSDLSLNWSPTMLDLNTPGISLKLNIN